MKYNRTVRKKALLIFLALFLISIIFFYPFWLKGEVPFPGDLLLAEYGPWKNYSYFGYAPGAVPNKAQSFDTLRQLYPWRYLAVQGYKQGKWPLWNPYNFSGAPLLANFQTAAFYPLNFLYFVLPFNFSWAVQVMLQPLLASLFFLLFARRLKISLEGSFLGAVAFGYSSFMTVWLEYNTIGHVILWLPLALLAVELVLESFSLFRFSLLVGSLTFSFLAGHLQDFATLYLFVQIYLLARVLSLGFKSYFGRWLKILLISVFPFFLGAVQLLPGLELIFHSARSPLPKDFLLEKVLLQPWQLISAFIPDFFGNPATRNYFLTDTYIGKVLYIGLLPLAFSILAVLGKKNFWIWFFSLAALICLFLTIASSLTGFLYALPIFSSLSPTRILFIFQFSLAVLAGFGLDKFVSPKLARKKKLIPLILIFFVFLVAGFFASGAVKSTGHEFLTHLNVVRRNLVYSGFLFLGVSGLFFVCLVKKKSLPKLWQRILLGVMIAFVIADLFRFFTKITPFSPPEFIFPEAKVLTFLQSLDNERFWGYGTAYIEANYNAVFSLFSSEGYDPLYPRQYGEFIRSAEDGRIKPAVRSDAVVKRGFGRTDFAENTYRPRVLEALNVRYILDRAENQTDETTFPPESYSLIWQDQGWRIYESKKAAPRAYMTSKIHFAKTTTDFEKIFFSPDFTPATQVILTEETLKTKESLPGKVTIEAYQPNLVKLSTVASQDQVLVLADNYYPGWKVFIDGKRAPIYKANYTFRASLIPLGEHQIEFKYQPMIFRIGLIISSLSIIGWLLAGVFTIILKRA